MPLRRLADVHAQRPGEDHKHLVLELVAVTPALRAGVVAPHVGGDIRKTSELAQLGDMP